MIIIPPQGTRAPRRRSRGNAKPARPFAAAVAVAAAAIGVAVAHNATQATGGASGTSDFRWLAIVGLGAMLAIVAGVLAKLALDAREGSTDDDATAAAAAAANAAGDPEGEPVDDAARGAADHAADEAATALDEDTLATRRRVAAIVGLLVLAIAAAAFLLSVSVTTVSAQSGAAPLRAAEAQAAGATEERGGFAMVRGADTLVRERFIRRADALQGEVNLGEHGRIAYFATLARGATVRPLTVQVPTPGAPADAPLHTIVIRMLGDTVAVQSGAGLQRIPTRAGAIPFINNSLAVTEFLTRRAREAGGTADIPLWATSGGVTLLLHISPIGPDSLLLAFPGQPHRLAVDPAGRIMGGAIPSLNIRIVRLGPDAASGMAFSPPPEAVATPRDYSPPPGAPYTAEEVRVRGPGGITLGGTLTTPRGAGPFPAIVTITGSGAQDRDEFIPLAGGVRLFRQVADTLTRRGIAVLRMDDRGVGASGGDLTTSTSADFADDIRAAVAYLRRRPDIDAARIGLLGHSEGGLIAPMVAATDPALRAVIVLAGPASTGVEISRAQNRYLIDHQPNLTSAQKDSMYAAAVAQLDTMTAATPWIRFWLSYDPAPAARKVKAPTLIVQGETDRQVPAAEAQRLAAMIRGGGNTDVTVTLLPNVNHLFVTDPDGNPGNYNTLKSNMVSPAMLGVVADWAVKRLCEGACAGRRKP